MGTISEMKYSILPLDSFAFVLSLVISPKADAAHIYVD